MPCPTCDHTMQLIAQDDVGTNHFWCPRCGTVHADRMDQGGDKTGVPKLVERCRRFHAGHIGYTKPVGTETDWRQLGISEAIHKPESR